MRKFMLCVAAMVVSVYSFADIQPSNLTKNSPQLKALGQAWNNQPVVAPQQDKNDITMVYGGEDISRRPTLGLHTATA